MDSIQKQAHRARRRMIVERFLTYLPWTLSIALAVALAALLLPKLTYLEVDRPLWVAVWLGGAALLAVLVSLCLTWMGRPTAGDAATEIDRRFELRERLSSALLIDADDALSESGQALLADANRRAQQLDVRDRFTWGLQRKLLFPVVPLLIAGLLWLVPDRAAPELVSVADGLTATQVSNSTKPLLDQIKKKRLEAEQEGLNEAAEMFKQLEAELNKLDKAAKLDTKQTLAKLNDIKKKLEERRQELGGSDTLKKNLQNMEKLDAGPAEKLADGLKQGDFEKAEQALEKLMEKIKTGEMTPAEAEQLKKQLEQLEKSMSEAAEGHEQAKQNLKEQMEQAEAAGDMQKAAQLQAKLEQMQAQDANMAMMQQMANALKDAQQAMKQGDMQAAQDALGQMADQLQQMNASDAQLQDLDQLMDSLSQSKSQMACKQCNGKGCSGCMSKMPSQMAGRGMGEGQGSGERPEEEEDVDFFDSRVREKMKQGETVYGGKVGGDNRKGTTQVEIQDAVLASLAEEPEPLDDTPLPKLQRDHTRDYFNSLREGTGEK
ncbi:MAG: hypothetical protein IT422_17815 [Pirellulaceae bacterium]|nr:hypothetical protein [Pirellulaceae bacterium]